MRIHFLGGADTVTGAKHLVEAGDSRILLDCGLYQGFKLFRERNWAPLPVDARSIDAVVLSHAHIDHSGWLPVLVKSGFKGPVIATASTRALAEGLLGACAVTLEEHRTTLAFSGDLGRPDDLLMPPPQRLMRADVMIVESTRRYTCAIGTSCASPPAKCGRCATASDW